MFSELIEDWVLNHGGYDTLRAPPAATSNDQQQASSSNNAQEQTNSNPDNNSDEEEDTWFGLALNIAEAVMLYTPCYIATRDSHAATAAVSAASAIGEKAAELASGLSMQKHLKPD